MRRDPGKAGYLESLIERCAKRCHVDIVGMEHSEMLDNLAEEFERKEREVEHSRARFAEVEWGGYRREKKMGQAEKTE